MDVFWYKKLSFACTYRGLTNKILSNVKVKSMPVRRSAWIKFVTDNRKSNESYGEALHRLAPEWHRRQSAAGIPTSRKRRPSRARRGVFTRSKSRSRSRSPGGKRRGVYRKKSRSRSRKSKSRSRSRKSKSRSRSRKSKSRSRSRSRSQKRSKSRSRSRSRSRSGSRSKRNTWVSFLKKHGGQGMTVAGLKRLYKQEHGKKTKRSSSRKRSTSRKRKSRSRR